MESTLRLPIPKKNETENKKEIENDEKGSEQIKEEDNNKKK